MTVPHPAHRARRRNLAIIVVAVAVVLVAAGGYGLWYLFLRPAGPAAVSSEALVLPSAAASSPLAAGGLAGTWNVDTSIGSSADSTDSFVGYRVQEQLASIGANTAVGRTAGVSGTLTITGTQLTAATITADLTALQSDDQRRDGQLPDRHVHPDLTGRPRRDPDRRPRDRRHGYRHADAARPHEDGSDPPEGSPFGLDHRGRRVAADRLQRLRDRGADIVRRPVGRRPGHDGAPALLQPRLSATRDPSPARDGRGNRRAPLGLPA